MGRTTTTTMSIQEKREKLLRRPAPADKRTTSENKIKIWIERRGWTSWKMDEQPPSRRCVCPRERRRRKKKKKKIGAKKKGREMEKEWSSKWRGRYPQQQPAAPDGWGVSFYFFFLLLLHINFLNKNKGKKNSFLYFNCKSKQNNRRR